MLVRVLGFVAAAVVLAACGGAPPTAKAPSAPEHHEAAPKPESVATTGADPDAAVEQAEALEKAGKPDEARRVLRRFVEEHADVADADLYDALGWAEHGAKDAARSEAAFMRALAISKGGDPEAHYGLAVLAADRNDPKAAEAELRALLAIDPSRWDALKTDASFEEVRTAPGIRALLETRPAPAAHPPDKPKHGHVPQAAAPKPAPDAEKTPRPEISLDAEQLGPVTYAGARVDVSLSKWFAFFPSLELLRVAASSPDEPDGFHVYAGGGVVVRPDDAWSLEAAVMLSPSTQHLESQAGRLSVTKDFGSDTRADATVEAELSFEATHFRWDDGLGPAGAELLQAHLAASVLVRPVPRLELTPRAMYFLYDKALDQAVGNRLGSALALAHVGAFAPPRVLAGLRAGYAVLPWLMPLVHFDEIGYAYGSGGATELLGGAKLSFRPHFALAILVGALMNRTKGPLVPIEDQDKTLPVALLEMTFLFN